MKLDKIGSFEDPIMNVILQEVKMAMAKSKCGKAYCPLGVSAQV